MARAPGSNHPLDRLRGRVLAGPLGHRHRVLPADPLADLPADRVDRVDRLPAATALVVLAAPAVRLPVDPAAPVDRPSSVPAALVALRERASSR